MVATLARASALAGLISLAALHELWVHDRVSGAESATEVAWPWQPCCRAAWAQGLRGATTAAGDAGGLAGRLRTRELLFAGPLGRPAGTASRRTLDGVIVRRLGLVPYADAWRQQQELHAEVVAGGEDVALLLEHPPVYTAGKRTDPWERPTDGTPVVDVDRGGKITWHGPGQVTGYPLVRLADPVDVVDYVRRLEQVLIDVCAEVGLATDRVEGRSGVWTPDGARKVAAVGIRVSRGVTMHGFALNADPDLTAYDRIVPCGIADAGVTSLTRELGRPVGVDDVLPLLEERLPQLSATRVG